MTPWIILAPEKDNVAIALRELGDGEQIESLAIRENVPIYHKVALRDIAKGRPIYKYGQIIGYATKPIDSGDWVHTHNLGMEKLMEEEHTVPALLPPPAEEPVVGRYFLGYRDSNGRPATRNYVLIASTVDCSAHVVELATAELNKRQEWYARRYPNVDGIVGLTHDSGCGLVVMSSAHQRQNLTMRNLVHHPNVGQRLVVQLGCEKSQASTIFEKDRIRVLDTQRTPDAGTVPFLTMQESGGTWRSVEQIIDYVEKVLLPRADKRRRTLIPAEELIMAAQCGGSNAMSGFTANAAIGYASDLLVRCGGTPFISETTETFGAGHLLTSRAKSGEIAQRYLDFASSYREYLQQGEGTPEHNLAHGNIEGGLTTIAEKSLGAVAKGGKTALCWVNDYAETVTERGFGFMNGPAFDPVSATGQTAGGAHVGVFSTGAGSCFGGILIPCIKIVSNTLAFEAIDDMEINAGLIAEGKASLEEVGRHIFEQVLATASGAKTYSEKIGYAVVNIWNSGVVT